MTLKETVIPSPNDWEEILNREGKEAVVKSLNTFFSNFLGVNEISIRVANLEPKDELQAQFHDLLGTQGSFQLETLSVELKDLFDQQDGGNVFAHEISHVFLHTYNKNLSQKWSALKEKFEQVLGAAQTPQDKTVHASSLFADFLVCKIYDESVASLMGSVLGRKTNECYENLELVRKVYPGLTRYLSKLDDIFNSLDSPKEKTYLLIKSVIAVDSFVTVFASLFSYLTKERLDQIDLKKLFFVDPMVFNKDIVEQMLAAENNEKAVNLLITKLKNVLNK